VLCHWQLWTMTATKEQHDTIPPEWLDCTKRSPRGRSSTRYFGMVVRFSCIATMAAKAAPVVAFQRFQPPLRRTTTFVLSHHIFLSPRRKDYFHRRFRCLKFCQKYSMFSVRAMNNGEGEKNIEFPYDHYDTGDEDDAPPSLLRATSCMYNFKKGDYHSDNNIESIEIAPASSEAAIKTFIKCASMGTAVICLSEKLQDMLLKYEWMQQWRYSWCLIGLLYIFEGGSYFARYGIGKYTAEDSDCIQPPSQQPPSSLLPSGMFLLPRNISPMLRLATMIAGMATIVGGAADAFLPVYVTGPNLFTSAGMEPDAAAFLCVTTVVLFVKYGIHSDRANGDIKEKNLLLDAFTQKKKEVVALENSVHDNERSVDSFSKNRRSFFVDLILNGGFIGTALLISQLYILGTGSFDEIFSWFASMTP